MLPSYSSAIATTLLLACRSALFLTSLPGLLRNDAQLSSPLTNYTRLKEGIYLFQSGFDPYAGGVFRQSPIFLSLFSTILPLTSASSYILWSLCDGLAVWCLVQIWRLRSKTRNVSHEILIATIYLFHPYNFLPTLALSISTLDNTLHILCLYLASSGQRSASLLTLALLTCSSLPSILYLPPIILLMSTSPKSNLASPAAAAINWHRSIILAAEFLFYIASLALVSTVVAGNLLWIGRTWGAVISLPDLTPNPGVWWYFFTEMFDHYRPFFLMVFSVHLLIYVAPVTMKLSHDPLFATLILQGIVATFKSYPTLSDPGLFTSMLALFPEIQPYYRHPLPTVMLHIHAALLLPLFHHLWLGQGSGNANFFYASTLVFGLANAAAVVDALRAGLRFGFGWKEGWELVQS